MNTKYYLNMIMGNVFHSQPVPALPEKYYIGLSTTAPDTSGGSVTEPSTEGTGYARVELKDLSEPEEGAVHNTAAITFNESIKEWGVITHYVVFDEETEGHPLFYNALTQERTVDPNTLLVIKAGELNIELCNPTE